MAPDYEQIIAAFKTAFTSALTGALAGRVYDFEPGDVMPPAAAISLATGEAATRATLDDAYDVDLTIKLIVGAQDDRSGQAELKELIQELRNALNTIDQTLGGLVDDIIDSGPAAVGDVEWAGITRYGAQIGVTILA